MPAPIPISYRALVHPEEEGGYWAEVPDLPGCFGRGLLATLLKQSGLTEKDL